MSNAWLTWAFQQEGLKSGEKFVLVVLADHADQNGYCYPSQERMAEYTNLNRRSIQKHCAELEAKGFIQRTLTSGRKSNYLRYEYDLTKPGENSSPGKKQHEPGETFDKTGRKSFALTPNEPSENPHVISPPEGRTASFDDFWKEWRSGTLHNKNESKKQAEGQWSRLTPDQRQKAVGNAKPFQSIFVEENGADCTMLHACRYLSQHRWDFEASSNEGGPSGSVRIGKYSKAGLAWEKFLEGGKRFEFNGYDLAALWRLTSKTEILVPSEYPPELAETKPYWMEED